MKELQNNVVGFDAPSIALLFLTAFLILPDIRYSTLFFFESLDVLVLIALLFLTVKFS